MSLGLARGRPTNPARDTRRAKCWKSQHFGRLVSVASAVAVTGSYGLVTGQYAAIEVVWAIAGPLVGAVVAYYFGVHRRDSG